MNADHTLLPRVYWRALLWWLVPLAVLAAVVGWELDWGRQMHHLPSPPVAIDPKQVTPALLPEYQIEGGIAAHTETVNRTLFNPTRRPAPVVATDSGPKRIQIGQFVLTGTTVAGERAVAFLKEVAGGKSRAVRQGDQINGMKVAVVAPDRVKLTMGDESEELLLKVAPGPKTTTVAAPPPPSTPLPAAATGAPAAPGQAPAAAAPVRQDDRQTLQERRRAAREAAAAATAAGTSNSQPTLPNPQPALPNPQPALPTAPPTPSSSNTPPSGGGGMPASTDQTWNEVFRRMQQRGK